MWKFKRATEEFERLGLFLPDNIADIRLILEKHGAVIIRTQYGFEAHFGKIKISAKTENPNISELQLWQELYHKWFRIPGTAWLLAFYQDSFGINLAKLAYEQLLKDAKQ